jgi:dipeptidase D
MENKKSVILQAYMDMVPQRNEATEHNFRIYAIEAYTITEADGDWVTAEGTTLGADNGIGLP